MTSILELLMDNPRYLEIMDTLDMLVKVTADGPQVERESRRLESTVGDANADRPKGTDPAE